MFKGISLPPCELTGVVKGLEQEIKNRNSTITSLKAHIKDQKIRAIEAVLRINRQHAEELAVRDQYLHQLVDELKNNSAKKAETEVEEQTTRLIASLQKSVSEAVAALSSQLVVSSSSASAEAVQSSVANCMASLQNAVTDAVSVSISNALADAEAAEDHMTTIVQNAVRGVLEN